MCTILQCHCTCLKCDLCQIFSRRITQNKQTLIVQKLIKTVYISTSHVIRKLPNQGIGCTRILWSILLGEIWDRAGRGIPDTWKRTSSLINILHQFIVTEKVLKWHDNIYKNEMGGTCCTYGGQERCIQSFGGETWRKEPFGRPRHRWDCKIKMDFQEVGVWNGLIWLTIGTGCGLL